MTEHGYTPARDGNPGIYKIVIATGFGIFLGALDGSIVNVSLYTIAEGFSVGMPEVQWVVVTYLLIITSLMPLMGKFGDRFGKARVFQIGMLLFILGSFSCAVSVTLHILIASRVFQAIGGSMMTANGLALVTYYSDPKIRGRAMGMSSMILAAALGLGPPLGGLLTQYFGWPSVFLVNVPIGLVGLIVIWKFVPETKRVSEARFDTIGASLFFGFLFVMILAVSTYNKVSIQFTFGLLIAFVLLFLLFIERERVFGSPIIPMYVLADKRIAISIFTALLAFMSYIPISYLLAFYLQDALGLSPSITGLVLVTHPVMISFTGPLSGLIAERINARIQTVIGLLVQIFGIILLGFAIPNLLLIIISIAILGTGLSLFTVANNNFIMTSAPKEYMGVVSALSNLSRTSGFTIAIATATTVFAIFMTIFNPSGLTQGPQYIDAYSASFQMTAWFFIAFAVIAAILSIFRGKSPYERQREQYSPHDDITINLQ